MERRDGATGWGREMGTEERSSISSREGSSQNSTSRRKRRHRLNNDGGLAHGTIYEGDECNDDDDIAAKAAALGPVVDPAKRKQEEEREKIRLRDALADKERQQRMAADTARSKIARKAAEKKVDMPGTFSPRGGQSGEEADNDNPMPSHAPAPVPAPAGAIGAPHPFASDSETAADSDSSTANLSIAEQMRRNRSATVFGMFSKT